MHHAFKYQAATGRAQFGAGLRQDQFMTEPTTVFAARRVITMDSGLPDATAVAVAGGRIVAAGELEELVLGPEPSTTPSPKRCFCPG